MVVTEENHKFEVRLVDTPLWPSDWEILVTIFSATLGVREPEKLKHGFEQSMSIYAYANDKLVAAARLITDGIFYGLLVDVVVDPLFQRDGLGTRMVEELMTRANLPLILIQAVPGVEGFYSRLGFRQAKTGMAHFRNPEKAEALGYL